MATDQKRSLKECIYAKNAVITISQARNPKTSVARNAITIKSGTESSFLSIKNCGAKNAPFFRPHSIFFAANTSENPFLIGIL
jgi:hypothetical protein